MPDSSTISSPATLLVIPLTDARVARWVHGVIAVMLFVQALMMKSAAPAACISLLLALLACWSARRAQRATGQLYFTQAGWCLVDEQGVCWRAPAHAAAMPAFAFALHLRRGFRARWVVLTRADCGTGPWRALRRAVTLYGRRPGLKDRVLGRRQCLRKVPGEV